MSAVESPPVPPSRPARRWTVPVVITATLLVLGLVSGVGTLAVYRHLDGNLKHPPVDYGHRPSATSFPGEDRPLNVLVMGSDSRDCAGCHIDGEGGDGGSDTTILLHLSRDHTRAYAVSIPRDTMVDRPRCHLPDGSTLPAATYQQWNTAYALGAQSCTIQQFQALTHIRVDDYVDVDFGTFQGMVDAVGGVQVCVPTPIDSVGFHIHIPAGHLTLDGREALAYVRVRHGVGDNSDLSRLRRQQAFLASLVSAVLSAHTLDHPQSLLGFLDSATSGLSTDVDLGGLTRLGFAVRHIGADHISFLTIPYEADPQNPAARVVWAPQAAEVWKRLREDRPLTRDEARGSITAGNVPGQSHQHHREHRPSGPSAATLSANGLCA